MSTKTASANTKTAEAKTKSLRESEKKWGKAAIAAGFTLFPTVLLQKQHALGLDCTDIVIILQILKHWWHAESAPYPSQVRLAKTMDVDLSTVKRHLARLRAAGLIDWKKRQNKHGGHAANAYDLSGLIKQVDKLATAELAVRAKEVDGRKLRSGLRGAALRAIAGGKADSDE